MDEEALLTDIAPEATWRGDDIRHWLTPQQHDSHQLNPDASRNAWTTAPGDANRC
ncbi:hypothetical protein [Streptomyces sp. NPDC056682]|uniref:hypothetical protein n=1 Tax=Streptomyces sp. NPDC056682 TaxID=3345909 RepID=UPI00367BB801